MHRCDWANSSTEDQKYHDEQWGVPVHDDRLLFEMLTLEGAQAGLSWTTILKKRQGYLDAFDNFDVNKVARYTDAKIEQLMNNPGIVRNRAKLLATVTNAKQFLALQKQYDSFDRYIWSFVDAKPVINNWRKMSDVPAQTTASQAMSKDLKSKGFKFVGPTICYAYMQATGMVNDHLTSCFRHRELK